MEQDGSGPGNVAQVLRGATIVALAGLTTWTTAAAWRGDGFGPAMLLVMGIALVTPLLVGLIVASQLVGGRRRDRRRRAARGVALVLGAMVTLLGVTIAVSRASVRTSKKRGDEVVAAIECHLERTRELPVNLASLTTEEGDELPLPTMGGTWHYATWREEYRLGFDGPFLGFWYWGSLRREWRSD
jgi:hypothetical protein